MWLLLFTACTDLQAYITDNMSPEYETSELVVKAKEVTLHEVLNNFLRSLISRFFQSKMV